MLSLVAGSQQLRRNNININNYHRGLRKLQLPAILCVANAWDSKCFAAATVALHYCDISSISFSSSISFVEVEINIKECCFTSNNNNNRVVFLLFVLPYLSGWSKRKRWRWGGQLFRTWTDLPTLQQRQRQQKQRGAFVVVVIPDHYRPEFREPVLLDSTHGC